MDTTKNNSPKSSPTQQLFELLKKTPLGESSNIAEVMALISAGADVNATNTFGHTPLVMAATYGNAGMIIALVGAQDILVNKADPLGKTALMMAAESGYTEIVKILLYTRNILVNKRDNVGATALMQASRNNQTAIITLLLSDPKILVNLKNFEGESALVQAVNKNRRDAITALLTSPNIEVDEAITVAKENHSDDLVSFLETGKNAQNIDSLAEEPSSSPAQPDVTFRYTSIKIEQKSPDFKISVPLDASLEGLQLEDRKNIKSPLAFYK